MHSENPYTAPHSNLTEASSASGTVSALTLEYLRRTKGWARFVSIVTFILSGFMVLAGIGIILTGGAAFAMDPEMGSMGGGVAVGMGIFYILLSFLYIYPAVKLFRYASRIGDLLTSRKTVDLEQALAEQMGFWRFVGILMAIMVGTWVLIFGFAMLAGVLGALASR